MAKSANYTIATLDAETDPFVYGRIPEPFCWGLYTGEKYFEVWDDEKCTDKIIEIILSLETKHIIYAHNGGKFDFFYLLKKGVLADPLKIINGRIVSARIGIHEIRDSYAILPMPLAGYKKDDIDYTLFEAETREKHKADILHYLAKDCEYLFELVEAFINEFGINLTIGATSIKKIKELCPFEKQNITHDERFRPYYFGGRVQCFEKGELKANWQVFDVNSMYPYVMAKYQHPTGAEYKNISRIPDSFYKDGILPGHENKPYFIDFDGHSKGALCTRQKSGLDFTDQSGNFKTMSHELLIGLNNGLIEIENVNEILVPDNTIDFGLFVFKYIQDKIQAKKDGDKLKEILTKFLLNSGYGKFGQNPENFYDYLIVYKGEQNPNQDIWDLDIDLGFARIWKTPAPKPVYYDVATAASITSAARSVLLEAIINADRPVYCDTDSIICNSLKGVSLDPFKLGSWDLEAKGDSLYIAGKKLYTLFDNDNPVKLASKGARLLPADIVKLANDEIVTWQNDAPNFKLNGEVKFIERNIRKR